MAVMSTAAVSDARRDAESALVDAMTVTGELQELFPTRRDRSEIHDVPSRRRWGLLTEPTGCNSELDLGTFQFVATDADCNRILCGMRGSVRCHSQIGSQLEKIRLTQIDINHRSHDRMVNDSTIEGDHLRAS